MIPESSRGTKIFQNFSGMIPESSREELKSFRDVTRQINHCDRHITLHSDTDISVGLINLFTYCDMPFG